MEGILRLRQAQPQDDELMGKITDIKLQKNKKRFNIFVDNKFRFALAAETLVKAGLKIGQEITEEDIRILRYKDIKNKY